MRRFKLGTIAECKRLPWAADFVGCILAPALTAATAEWQLVAGSHVGLGRLPVGCESGTERSAFARHVAKDGTALALKEWSGSHVRFSAILARKKNVQVFAAQVETKKMLWSAFLLALAIALVLATVLYLRRTRSAIPLPLRPSPQAWENGRLSMDGKEMTIERLSDQLLIVRIHNFLSDDEGEHLKTIARERLSRSTVQADKRRHEESDQRTSSTAFLNAAEDEVVQRIEQRAANLCGYPVDHLEPLQILRYQPGQRYDAHHDYFPRKQLGNSGQRHATYFVYLSDIEDGLEGGETEFPKLKLKVTPVRNSAVFWYNCDANGKELDSTFHGGLPPNKGEKWGMNIWIRERKAR